jgi:hypothetical protein
MCVQEVDGPGGPAIGLPGERSRIRSVVRIFWGLAFGQDLASDQFRKKIAKSSHFLGKRRSVRRVGVDAVSRSVLVVAARRTGAFVW